LADLKEVTVPSPGDGRFWEQIQENGQLKYAFYTPAHRSLTGEESVSYDTFLVQEGEKYRRVYRPMDPVPWPLCSPPKPPQPDLWERVYAYIYNHVDFADPRLYDVLTAWVFYTWMPEAFTVAPYLRFLGKKATGKTRALEVLQHLSYRGTLTPSLTEAALFRFLEDYHITFLLDETEIYGQEQRQTIQHVLNAGYKRGQHVFRVESLPTGELVPRGFRVFGPKALAGTRPLKDTLESRCLQIVMERNTREVAFTLDVSGARRLRGELQWLRWRRLADLETLEQNSGDVSDVSDVYDVSIGAPPTLRHITDGRLIELATPLIIVAEMFGEEGAPERVAEWFLDSFQRSRVEAGDTLEGVVVEAINKVAMEALSLGLMTTRMITDAINEERPEHEHISARVVGKVVKALGFVPKRTPKARGYVLDLEKLCRLNEEFGLPPYRETSLMSLTSLTSQQTEGNAHVEVSNGYSLSDGAEGVKKPQGSAGSSGFLGVRLRNPVLQERLLEVYGAVPGDGVASTEEIIEATGLPREGALRFLRMLVGEDRVFEPWPGLWRRV